MIKKIIAIILFINVINCININLGNNNGFNILGKSDIIKKNNNNFTFLIDTGSPYIWISNEKIKKCKNINVKDINLLKNNLNISYNGGDNVSINLYNDTFYINNKTIKNTIFGVTNYESDNVKNNIFDGIMGLGGFIGNSTIIDIYIKNLLPSIMFKQKIINKNIFSLYINYTFFNSFNIWGGQLLFGEKDNSKYEGNIKWYDIYKNNDTYYFWFLNFTKIKIKNDTLNIDKKVLIDSGTSDIVLNRNICDMIHEKINGKYDENYNRYIINKSNNLNDIIIYLENDEFILNYEDYTFVSNKTTYSKIVPNDNSPIVLGLPFLQKYYTVYDIENRKIGIAKNKS